MRIRIAAGCFVVLLVLACAWVAASESEEKESHLIDAILLTHLRDVGIASKRSMLSTLSLHNYDAPRLVRKRDRILAEIDKAMDDREYAKMLTPILAPHFSVEEAVRLVEALRDPLIVRLQDVLREHKDDFAEKDDEWKGLISREYAWRFAGLK